jgi:hypothetical protein
VKNKNVLESMNQKQAIELKNPEGGDLDGLLT